MKFEMVSLVARKTSTGLIYSIIRQLCTRKTTASRKLHFDMFIEKLRHVRIFNPLQVDQSTQLTVSSDFETIIANSRAQSFCDLFRPDEASYQSWNDYVLHVMYRCDLHAKRAILENTGTSLSSLETYSWAVATRKALDSVTARNAFFASKIEGVNANRFRTGNKVAHVLWFQSLYKHDCPVLKKHVFFHTN